VGKKLQIFQQTLQISGIIPTDSSRFAAEEIMGAQNFYFVAYFPEKVFSPKFCIFGPHFSYKRIFPKI